jgi:hypothetical protein
MGFLFVLIPISAAILYFVVGWPLMGTASVLVAVVTCVALLMMHRHANEAARDLGIGQPGLLFDNTPDAELQFALDAVPDRLSLLSALLAIAGVILLVVAIIAFIVQ